MPSNANAARKEMDAVLVVVEKMRPGGLVIARIAGGALVVAGAATLMQALA